MSDKQIYEAYELSHGILNKYVFEYPIIEYWAEPESQKELKDYLYKHSVDNIEAIYVKPSKIVEFIPYKESKDE